MSDYLTGGEVFSSLPGITGRTVTPTRLNHHVTGAKILPAFMDSSTHAAPAALTDLVLTCDGAFAAFNMPTLTQLFAMQVADAAAGVASLRTLGFTGLKAAQGSLTPQLAADNSFTGRNHLAHLTGDITNQPTCTVNAVNTTGAGVGATATLGVQGCDWFGQVLLTPAGTPGASAKMFTINTFHLAFATNAPAVFIIPINPAAVIAFQTAGKAVVQANVTTAGFEVWSGTTALTAGTAYSFGYLALGG